MPSLKPGPLAGLAAALAAPTPRYVVALTAEGFQVEESTTGKRKADVWAARFKAQKEADELNERGADA